MNLGSKLCKECDMGQNLFQPQIDPFTRQPGVPLSNAASNTNASSLLPVTSKTTSWLGATKPLASL